MLDMGNMKLNFCDKFGLIQFWLNKFHATDPFLYPLKTLENQRFFMFSGGIERDQ